MTFPARFAIVAIVTMCLSGAVLRTRATKLPELVGKDGKPRHARSSFVYEPARRLDNSDWIKNDPRGGHERHTRIEAKGEKNVEEYNYTVKEGTKLMMWVLPVAIIVSLKAVIAIIVLCVCLLLACSRLEAPDKIIQQEGPLPYPFSTQAPMKLAPFGGPVLLEHTSKTTSKPGWGPR